MSTINAQNYGDGTDSVPASAVLEGTAKAWSYSIYAAGVPANTASFNVSSITDLGVGTQEPNFTNAFSGTSYAVVLGSQFTTVGNGAFLTQDNAVVKTASKCRIDHFQASVAADPDLISIAAFGDLA